MKSFYFVLISRMGRIILFLVTFAIGVAASIWFWSQNVSPAVPPQQTLPRAFERPNVQALQDDVKEVESPIGPNVVQSSVVDFPVSGRVVVRSIEEAGRFPQMLFISEKTGRVLHRSSIEDKDKWLIPEKDSQLTQPDLRFRVVRSPGFKSPMIMSVGLFHGGSDDAFFLTVFGEVDGKIRRLNKKPMFANIQGGYYLGYLNNRLGYGLAVWDFNWDDGGHYDEHKYEVEIYQLKGRRFMRTLRKISQKKYGPDKGANSLRELGINAVDQRAGIPIIKENLE